MVTLRVLTSEDPPDAVIIPLAVVCDESYLCPCKTCELERARLMRYPHRHASQPWELRAA